ncbi:unnamed protein product [Prunus armeniaca]|uniref:Uncharacterized protein n=1 Tax=Prunus armeniaca TaxID=36596 RepID=A0A6J5UIZ7_PRUAR|nr:unnamed protein product [Prunus armeniaca]
MVLILNEKTRKERLLLRLREGMTVGDGHDGHYGGDDDDVEDVDDDGDDGDDDGDDDDNDGGEDDGDDYDDDDDDDDDGSANTSRPVRDDDNYADDDDGGDDDGDDDEVMMMMMMMMNQRIRVLLVGDPISHCCPYKSDVPKNAIVVSGCVVNCKVCGCRFRGSCCANYGSSQGRAILKSCSVCEKEGEHMTYECPSREKKYYPSDG